MLTKKEFLSKIEEIIDQKYPNDNIDEELLQMFNFNATDILSSKIETPTPEKVNIKGRLVIKKLLL